VLVPALVRRVPNNIVCCVVALLNFAYTARRNAHDTSSLRAMKIALAQFHESRTVFTDVGICDEGFSLPRQHALSHYVKAVHSFGSPNGLCLLITESKHIDAVKRPWRRSNRNNAIFQMLKTNERMHKLDAARIEFARKEMLDSSLVDDAKRIARIRKRMDNGNEDIDAMDLERAVAGYNDKDEDEGDAEDQLRPEDQLREIADNAHEVDVGAVNDNADLRVYITLASKYGQCFYLSPSLHTLTMSITQCTNAHSFSSCKT
jgi:hypothetical protein